jgi:hypothetical protein
MSSIITISQPPSNPGDRSNHETAAEVTFAPMDDPENSSEDSDTLKDSVDGASVSEAESDTEAAKDAKAQAIDESLAKLQSGPRSSTDTTRVTVKVAPAQATVKRRVKNGPDAVIVLKEERVCYLRPISYTVYLTQ